MAIEYFTTKENRSDEVFVSAMQDRNKSNQNHQQQRRLTPTLTEIRVVKINTANDARDIDFPGNLG